MLECSSHPNIYYRVPKNRSTARSAGLAVSRKREPSAKKFLTEFLKHRFNLIDIRAHKKGKVQRRKKEVVPEARGLPNPAKREPLGKEIPDGISEPPFQFDRHSGT
jgi:hypothetical protein